MGGRLHAAAPDRGRPALAADRAQDPVRRQARLLRDPRPRRPGEGAPLPGPPRRLPGLRGGHRRHLLRQLQRQAHRLRVRPDGRGQQDRPHPRQRRDRSGTPPGTRSGTARWRTTTQGWTAEFRVPLNQLRYGPQDEQVWGMHAWRWIDAQPGRGPVAADPAPEHGPHVPARRAARDPRPAALAPRRAAAARGRQGELGPSVPGDGTDGAGSLGLDAKLGLTTNFTLDATVNPDFGQVEADPSVVNLTAYETFYEEKRPFFLEGRKIFAFGIEDDDQLFYSRRIGAGAVLRAAVAARARRCACPRARRSWAPSRSRARRTAGSRWPCCRASRRRRRPSVTSPLGSREPVVAPFGSYTVARLQKDWDKGNTILGGMVTSTHRFTDDAAPRVPAHPGEERRARLHALLRRPRVGRSRRAAS